MVSYTMGQYLCLVEAATMAYSLGHPISYGMSRLRLPASIFMYTCRSPRLTAH